jgi:hypothetical protein
MRQKICPNLRIDINVYFDNREKSIGTKRQALLLGAKGKYMSFIDDDDHVLAAYFEDAAACIAQGLDVCRLRGKINQYTFTHSLVNRLDMPMSDGAVFLRPPNHLNVMLADIAKCIPFGDAVRGEDLEWTIKLAEAGYLKSEYTSDPSRIHYIYDLGERTVDHSTMELQRKTTYIDMLKKVWIPGGQSAPQQKRGIRLGPRGFVSS